MALLPFLQGVVVGIGPRALGKKKTDIIKLSEIKEIVREKSM